MNPEEETRDGVSGVPHRTLIIFGMTPGRRISRPNEDAYQRAPPQGLPPGGYYTEDGGYYYPPGEGGRVRFHFETKEERLRFIRKVYAILTVQLLFTIGLVALFLYESHIKELVQKYSFLWMIVGGFFLVVYMLLLCVQYLRRCFPINIIMLAIFTVFMSLMLALYAAAFDDETILISFGITALLTLVITIFAMQTKLDLTLCVFCILLVFVVLLPMAIALIFFRNDILLIVFCSLGVLLFGIYLAFDTQQIMGGKTISITPNEYVLGAIHLYLDIILIFCCLGQCIAAIRR